MAIADQDGRLWPEADELHAAMVELGNRLDPREKPIAIQISPAERQHRVELLQRSYELAKQRGHIRV